MSNPEGFRFCGGCGAPLVGLAPRPAALTAKGLASRPSLEGERKLITALSADVKGSMDLAESTDPEVWHAAMDGLFKVLSAGVHRFEGTVQRFTGDGIMALFGAPVAHEDHARRACHAALHISDAIESFAVDLRRTNGLNFHVRIGVNSGEVVVGTIGDDLDMQYTAIGHAVGLADRIQALAAPGTPYITESTAALVEGHFRLSDLGFFALKGAREDVRVFAVEGASRPRAAIEIARQRGFSAFVGRAAEMGALQDALDRATEGVGQVVGVVGEPGVGKSRLCIQFAERCEAHGISVWRTHGVSHGKAIPFLPVLQILRMYFEIQDDDSPIETRERIAGRQVLLAPGFETDLPLLFDFLGVADPDRPAPPLGPDERMRRVLAVVEYLMKGRSQRQVAVILLDDLQWFDAASLAFFDRVIEMALETRTLVLANFRPEMVWDRPRIQLQPLDEAAVAQLVRVMLGRDPTLDALAGYVLDRTSGNPFFIEELVRGLIEEGALEASTGSYRLTRDVNRLDVPPTVQAVLAARIDRLSDDEKWVLQAASVIGRTFTLSLLSHVAGAVTAAAVDTLCAREFFDEVALHPGAEYQFRHPLTREVAYSSLLTDRRARAHRTVADAIVELDADRLDERAAAIALHIESAGDALEAAQWHERAGAWLMNRDLTAAGVHWRRAIDLVEGMTSDEAEALRLASIARIMRVASRVGMAVDEVLAMRERALPSARRRDDTFVLWAVYTGSCFSRVHSGEVDLGLVDGQESVVQAARSTDEGFRLYGRTVLGICHNYGGAPLAALADFAAVFDGLAGKSADLGREGPVGFRIAPFARAHHALTLALAGRLGEASDALAECLQATGGSIAIGVATADEPLTSATVAAHAAFLGWFSGQSQAAVEGGRAAVQVAEEWGADVWANLARVALAAALVTNERHDEALSVVDRALADMRSPRRLFAVLEGVALALSARAALAQGDRSRARRDADEAVATARGRGNFGLPWALFARALVSGSVGDVDEAERVIADTGQIVHQPFVHLQRARLARGDERAHELETAVALFHSIGAPARADDAEREVDRGWD